MSILHHPSEAVLAAYASGALPDGPSLATAAHLERCAVCRDEVALMEAVGGALLGELPDAGLEPQALDLALARIERPSVAGSAPRTPSDRRAFRADLPAALRKRKIGGRRFVAPGLWIAHVQSRRPDGWRTYLLHAGRGQGLLEHGHSGPEMTVVLTGAFRDGGGRYGTGDFLEADPGLEHQPRVEGDDPCLCLISARGRVKVEGLGRLLKPLLQV